MSKTIKITGKGRLSAKPDLAELSIELNSADEDYEKAAEQAEGKISALTEAVTKAGFLKEELKTSNFRVDTEYESAHDQNGVYRRVFKGYSVHQSLRLSFALDKELLGKALSAVTESGAAPEFSIRFLLKDPESFKDGLLRSAAADAKKAAETLCEAAGVKLGALASIDYSFSEAHFYSDTEQLMSARPRAMSVKAIDIEPEDVHAEENVTFVWEIE